MGGRLLLIDGDTGYNSRGGVIKDLNKNNNFKSRNIINKMLPIFIGESGEINIEIIMKLKLI